MKDKFKNYFFDVAILTGKLSTCQSREVGAVLVKDNRVVAIGYNGTAPGQPHCINMVFKDGEHTVWSRFNELHAEQNLIAFCAKNGININGCSMFLTLSPCIDCAKLIAAAGIKEVFYVNRYEKPDGGDFLERNGISFIKKG